MVIEEDLYEVVISGISGKYPLSDSVDELKEHLLANDFLVTEDDCRWNRELWKDVPAATGKISVVKKIDDTFFGIFSGVAAMLDPLTRVTMERAFEAIMDAGINPKNLRNCETAVYTASGTSDSEAVGCDEKLIAKFWLVAHAKSLLANRISYVLNLTGPSWTIDSSWIGGVQCLKQAITDIRRGRVESALVGVSSVILFPHMSQHWTRLGKLSPDGTCLPFQENANGYARSESTVFFFLQRENEAKRIYAKLNNVDTMFCGEESDTLLKPREEAFVKFLRSFYEHPRAIEKPVAFIEADGSADKHLDRVELNSIDRVLCEEKNNKNLNVGCVKSNLGHAEAASPYVAITKALIALDSEVIPPSRSCQPGSKKLKTSGSLNIVTKPTPFPEGKYAAVNAIGVAPSIGHVLLEQHAKRKKPQKCDNFPKLVLLSARHEPGLFRIIDKLESMPYDDEYFSMVNDVFKESMHGYFYRGFTILGGSERKLHFTLETGTPPKRPIWFVFAGMGSQWPGMGADLMNIPIFAAVMQELDSYLAPLGIDIVNVITSYDPTVLMNIVNCFVGIVAVQIGMIDVLKALGIEPDAMFGHSLGENMCAYADGCFTKYQTIMAAYYRGKASSEIPLKKGLMASVGLNYKNLPNLPPNVEIACHNSEDNVTISGPLEEVQKYISELEEQKVFVRVVKSNNVAYHSKQVEPLAPYVLENLRKVIPKPVKRSSKWISTSVPEKDWDSPLAQTSSAEYHVNNFKHTVYFAEACAHIPEDACIIEISPHGLFQGILKRMVSGSCFVVPLGKRETSNALHFLLSAIGKLFVVGLQPDINAIYPQVEYPVSRGTPSLANLATWNHETDWEINIYPHQEAGIKSLTVSLREPKWRFLTGYKINEKILMPFPKLLVETLHAYDTNDPILIFENVVVSNYIEITASETAVVYTQVQYGSGNFEITANNEAVLLSGMLRYSQESLPDLCLRSSDEDTCTDLGYEFTKSDVQNVLQQFSIKISSEMLHIDEVTFTEDGCVAVITWNKDLASFINSFALVKVFWELCTTNSGPLLTSRFAKFAVETEKYNSMSAGSKVTVHYYKNVNIFAGPGVQLYGCENSDKIVSFCQRQDVVFRDTKFVRHENPQTKTLENFFVLCAQLVGETFGAKMNHEKYERSAVVKIVLASEFEGDSNFLEKASILFDSLYQELPTVQIIAKYVKAEDVGKMQNSDKAFYFVVSNGHQAYIDQIKKLAAGVKNIFLLTMNKVPQIEDFTEVVREEIGACDIVLWKKKVRTVENIIKLQPYNNNDWVEVLEEKLMRHQGQSDSIILQWRSKYVTDIVEVIPRIKKIKSSYSIRYVVTTDADGLSLNLANHREHLEKGLVMNVMKDHKWGSIRQLIPQGTSSDIAPTQLFTLRNKNLKNITVEYVATDDETTQTKINVRKKVKAFDFSGTSTTDHKKMVGIAYSGKDHRNPEVYLTWQVPEPWSLENVVTVPTAYLKAYYSLTTKGKISSHSTVLVHNAYSVLGEALIAVALSFESTVYAVVTDSLQGKYLKERFRHSASLVVLNSGTVLIDIEILQRTHKAGVDIVVNAETEKQLLVSTTCVKTFGAFILLSEIPLQPTNQIGMDMFLRSTRLCSVSGDEMVRCESDVKSKFRKWLNEQLRNGVVKPFNHRVVHNSDCNSLEKLANEDSRIQRTIIKQGVRTDTKNLFTCDPEKVYLIIGPKNETWFTIVTSLIESNAKKLAFIDENIDTRDSQYMKRFSLYIGNRTDLSLMYVSAMALQDREETANMVKEMNAYAELDLIFCISLSSEKCEFIDYGARLHAKQIRQLICLQCDASVTCESRIQASQPALNVVWNQKMSDMALLIGNLKKLMQNVTRINSPLCCITQKFNFKEKFENSLMNKDSEFFPHYSEAEQFANSFSSSDGQVSFERHVSKCSHYSTRTQLFPVFILPGLHSYRLKPLIDNLMYPVYCAKYSVSHTSANTIAKSLIEPLKKVQPDGPYTIVGESWSGAIAIELVSLLERNDPEVKVNLILLEGLPKNMQSRLSALGLFGSPEFVSNLYETCFRNLKMEKTNNNGTKQKLDREKATFLELLERKLMVTKNYHSEKAFLRSKVVAVSLKEKSILDTYVEFEEHYGQNLELKTLDEDNYEELIRSRTTSSIINDNVLFKW